MVDHLYEEIDERPVPNLFQQTIKKSNETCDYNETCKSIEITTEGVKLNKSKSNLNKREMKSNQKPKERKIQKSQNLP